MKPDYKIETKKDIEHYAYQIIRQFDADTNKADYNRMVEAFKIVWNDSVDSCLMNAEIAFIDDDCGYVKTDEIRDAILNSKIN